MHCLERELPSLSPSEIGMRDRDRGMCGDGCEGEDDALTSGGSGGGGDEIKILIIFPSEQELPRREEKTIRYSNTNNSILVDKLLKTAISDPVGETIFLPSS